MMKRALYLLLVLLGLAAATIVRGQGCSNMNIQLRADVPSTCNNMVITMIHDQQGKPFLYVAGKEAGLKIYDISKLDTPVLVKTLPTSSYNSLEVMNLTQSGNYLYLAIGNHFTTNQNSGMAIVDVSNPAAAFVTDYYNISGTGGAGVVKVEGNYVYLGAMGNGLVILDVSDKSNIAFVSKILPDINYPTANPNASLYNARGMEVRNSIVYLCFDAGGLRIINATDKSKPVETGRYSNPVMNGKARAYNNIVLDDTLVYIAVDYCGVEVLNVKDTSKIKLMGWWNPYNCPNNNWFSSPVHANEIQYDKECKTLFLSTGKSDMYVLDMRNPAAPDSCKSYGGIGNNIGTWGIGLYQNQIYLSYICTIGIPFASNWTGVKILTYTRCASALGEKALPVAMSLFPNPAQNRLTVMTGQAFGEGLQITLTDMYGKKRELLKMDTLSSGGLNLDISDLGAGIYFINIGGISGTSTLKFIKTSP